MVSLDDVRNAIFAAMVETGRAPTLADLASSRGAAERAVADGYRTLAEAHVIVVRHGGDRLDATFANVGLTARSGVCNRRSAGAQAFRPAKTRT